jgi:putative FmdB family regulatory protein
MPLYEYKCNSCGKVFEVLQKFSDEPLSVHAECGGPAERLISAPAFHLKGSGWYATDYAKSNGASKPSETKSDSGESGASKTESKETKTETPAANESKTTTESKPAATVDSK